MAEPLHIENNVHLERLLSTDHTMEKEIRALVSEVLQAAAKEVSSAAADAIVQKEHQRGALFVCRNAKSKPITGICAYYRYGSSKI